MTPIRMVSVPVEPTDAMMDAWHGSAWPQGPKVSPTSQAGLAFKRHYAAMLTASPVREEGGVVLAKRVSPGEAINRAVGDEVLTAKALESITTAGWVFAHKDDIATREEAPAEAGERDVIARLVDPQTFDLIASYTGIDRGDGLTPAERESAVFGAYPKLKEDRDTAFAKADTIIALRAQPQASSGEG